MLMSLNVTSMQPGKFADKIQARINFQHDVFNPMFKYKSTSKIKGKFIDSKVVEKSKLVPSYHN